MSMQRLESKVALITGAASGIGEKTLRLFAKNGAFIVAADIGDNLGHEVAASIGSDRVSYHHCDVRDEKQIEETINYTLEKYGSLDILFCNAGILGCQSSILDLDLSQFDNTMANNVRGAAATMKHAARAMVAKKSEDPSYALPMCQLLLEELVHMAILLPNMLFLDLYGQHAVSLDRMEIRVNCVSPYGVATPLACGEHNIEPHQVEANCCANANLKGIVLKARHIAEAAFFLASDESLYISGHNLVVDGGISVVNNSFFRQTRLACQPPNVLYSSMSS